MEKKRNPRSAASNTGWLWGELANQGGAVRFHFHYESRTRVRWSSEKKSQLTSPSAVMAGSSSQYGGRRHQSLILTTFYLGNKTYKAPRRPFVKARLDQELQLAGKYGLRNKTEIWRVVYTLARIRKAARELLTLEEKDAKRLFEGNALIRRLIRIGVLEKEKNKLDYVRAAVGPHLS